MLKNYIKYSTFLGGKSHSEIHGARIAVWLATNSYYTYSKTNPMADCVICGKPGHMTNKQIGGDNWIHYIGGKCNVVEERFGQIWISMLQEMANGDRHPIQGLAWRLFPKTKLMWIIDPNNKNLGSYRLSCMDQRFPKVMEMNRRLIWAIHQMRSRSDVGLKIMGKIEKMKEKKNKKKKQKKETTKTMEKGFQTKIDQYLESKQKVVK